MKNDLNFYQGKTGKAITLVTPFDVSRIEDIEKLIRKKLSVKNVKDKEIADIFTEVAMARRESERVILS